ncbi:M1 family aminopeptidase [Arenimonas sp.]|uniref:M1 family aminopeptidase n=1 Tax=Arenimonas sp. TaxID=1872635 RepID=UPI0039E63BC1
MTHRFRWFLVLAVCGLGSPFAEAADPAVARGFDVLHYGVRLDPDLDAKTLRGRETIRLALTRAGQRELAFDAGALDIDSVQYEGRELAFSKEGKQLKLALPEGSPAGKTLEISLAYRGAPTYGLEFHPEEKQIYTIFSTSQWMVAIDAPDERASFALSVALPASFDAIGHGKAKVERIDAKQRLFQWQQKVPVPSFVYGFAAGEFAAADTRAHGVALRMLARDPPPESLRRVFADTGDMLAFFGERAGVRYEGRYDQALVVKTVGQELAGFSLLSEAYGQEVLEDAKNEGLIAHEAAHQWWGIGTTCRDWGHFWLNEGFATFMAAAYLEHRFGKDEYLKSVARWRERTARLVAEGKNHALVYQQWKPSGDDRAVVYQRGAYVLHLLRERLGEEKFWKGIRDYTREHRGRSVETADFQRAMQRSSGQDLDGFFRQQVYGSGGLD